jgi:MFS family permease
MIIVNFYHSIHEMSAFRELASLPRQIRLAVLVAALGYFVDVFDLVLFSIVRIPSLKELGNGDSLLSSGVLLLNMQLIGMLVGGMFWGMLGDKRGRVSVLFGSILTYSVANIANGFVHSIEWYAFWRFVAGFGLAGELGAGVTLASELMPSALRGWATTFIAALGVSGAIVAALLSDFVGWRNCFIAGGVLGLLLLLLRVSVRESGIFAALEQKSVMRGSFRLLLRKWERVKRYIACIGTGLPIWFVAGIIMTFSPEIGAALGMQEPITGSRAVLASYIGFVVGDCASGIVSQFLKSRRRAIFAFMTFSLAVTAWLLTSSVRSAMGYYLFLILSGFGGGYWAVFVTASAEQFGTNLRATVATTATNFVRGAAVPMTLLFRSFSPALGAAEGALAVAGIVYALAYLSLFALEETFHRELDWVEE